MRKIILAVLLLGLAGTGNAAETASFLKIGLGARAVGMGGAYTALADDVNAMGWNPAGLAGMSKRQLGAMHAELAQQTRYDFVGYGQPTKLGTWSAGLIYLGHGGLEGRDENGRQTGSYGASDQAFNVGFASRLDGGLGLGANVKYVRSAIGNVSAQTFAMDLGGQYALRGVGGPGLPLVGLALQNLGPGMRFQDETSQLPLTVAAGLGYRLPVGLTLGADFKQRPYSKESAFSVGTEYALLANFSLRAGYGTVKASNGASSGGLDALNGFATGLGFKLRSYSLDYSFTPMGELGNAQRFSLSARF